MKYLIFLLLSLNIFAEKEQNVDCTQDLLGKLKCRDKSGKKLEERELYAGAVAFCNEQNKKVNSQ